METFGHDVLRQLEVEIADCLRPPDVLLQLIDRTACNQVATAMTRHEISALRPPARTACELALGLPPVDVATIWIRIQRERELFHRLASTFCSSATAEKSG